MVDVTVVPDGVRIPSQDGETVLATLGRAGLRYRVGCRRGGCGVCKVSLRLGEVRYERPIADTVLSDDERVEGICLSCRAVPITSVVIELQEGDRLRRVLPYGFASAHATPAHATSAHATSAHATSQHPPTAGRAMAGLERKEP